MPKLAYRLYNDDCLDVMRGMKPDKVDTIICDPPYGLEFMGKKWDKLWTKRDKRTADLTGKSSSPFVAAAVEKYVGGKTAQDWHHAWATEALRVAKPGAFLLAFGGTRTFHRLACAIEDAGWEIRDCVMWVYGSGFPKSHSIGKAIDRAAGAEREVVGEHGSCGIKSGGGSKAMGVDGGYSAPAFSGKVLGAPVTSAAQLWDGWGTALKPAWEPVIVAMKPLVGTFAANALEHGVAGINVDGCRIPGIDPANAKRLGQDYTTGATHFSDKVGQVTRAIVGGTPAGRWPANLIWSHKLDEPCPACSGDYPACRLCGGTGVIKGCVRRGTKRVKGTGMHGKASGGFNPSSKTLYGKGNPDIDVSGGHADADGLETVEDWDCHPDCPSRAFPSQKSPANYTRNAPNSTRLYGGAKQVGEEQPGYGDSGSASRFFKCCNYGEADRLFYCAKASKRERTMNGLVPNSHPTVKPLSLMEYLCKLTMTPTGGIVLDPFMGSGSTGVACAMTGRQFIGIENDTEHGYFKVAQERIREAYRENPL